MIHTLSSSNHHESWTTNAQELMGLVFPPQNDIVPGIITEGGTILASSPKVGKTWLTLGSSLAVASGGYTLGGVKAKQGNVLYMALEDGKRRIQARLGMMLGNIPAPSSLDFVWKCPPINQGAIELIEHWIKSVDNPLMIVVDTIKRIRPEFVPGKPMYDSDYEVFAPLTDLAHEHHINITGNYHDRKMDADDVLDKVSGTHGLTGSCDMVLVLQRKRKRKDGFLWVIGRDTGDAKKAMRFDHPNWILLGDAEEHQISTERQSIRNAIINIGKPAAPKEVAKALGKNQNTTRVMLLNMKHDGDVSVNEDGLYVVDDI